jgi:hypothetical protein
MNGAFRVPLPLPLLVAGAALVVCGVRGPHSTTPAAAAAFTYAPPAVTATAPRHTPVRVVPSHPAPPKPRHRRPARPSTARHAVSPPPSRPAAAAAAPTTRPPAKPKPATTHVATRVVSGPTSWPALNAAIARIPTYRPGAARWVVSSKYDFWGTADWYHDTLYVDPSVPADKLFDVAVHEWSHELSVLDYGGDVAAATRAMNATFGGSGLTGPERAADCMSILQGATWTHYTTCTNTSWRAAASRLVSGKTL